MLTLHPTSTQKVKHAPLKVMNVVESIHTTVQNVYLETKNRGSLNPFNAVETDFPEPPNLKEGEKPFNVFIPAGTKLRIINDLITERFFVGFKLLTSQTVSNTPLPDKTSFYEVYSFPESLAKIDGFLDAPYIFRQDFERYNLSPIKPGDCVMLTTDEHIFNREGVSQVASAMVIDIIEGYLVSLQVLDYYALEGNKAALFDTNKPTVLFNFAGGLPHIGSSLYADGGKSIIPIYFKPTSSSFIYIPFDRNLGWCSYTLEEDIELFLLSPTVYNSIQAQLRPRVKVIQEGACGEPNLSEVKLFAEPEMVDKITVPNPNLHNSAMDVDLLLSGKTIKESSPSADEGTKPREAFTKDTNPKDALSSERVPLHLWPDTATAFGCLGLLEGALKYGRLNWRAGGARASVYYSAARRHFALWFEGEEVDPKTKVPHLASALANLAIIVDAQQKGVLIDDRQYPGGLPVTLKQVSQIIPHLQEMFKGYDPIHYTIQLTPPK